MSRWEMFKLRDVAPAKSSKQVFLGDEKIWNITLDQIESNTGKITEKKYIEASNAPQSSKFVDQKNVLYSKLRPYLNKVIIPDEKACATTELVPLFPDNKRLNQKYLLHFLRSPSFVSWATMTVAGVKMPRLTMSEFWEYSIPIPPLDEQQRIVDRLDLAQQLIERRKEQIALMDELVQALFDEMFGDPVKNEKGWEKSTLGHFLQIPPSNGIYKSAEYIGSGAFLIDNKCLYRGIYLELSDLRRMEVTPKEQEKYRVENGDILFNRVSVKPEGVGKCALAQSLVGDYVYESNMMRVRVDESKLLPLFINYQMNLHSLRSIIISLSNVGNQASINQSILKGLPCIFPPIQLQQTFVDRVQQIEALKRQMQTSLSELEQAFQALMQEAFET